MRRALIAATLALSIGPATAQWVPPATIPPPAPVSAVPSMAGLNLNDAGPGIMAAGVPWIRFNNQTQGISAVTLGKYAGVNLPNGQGMVAIGEWAMASQTDGTGENVVISPWGAPYVTTMHSTVFIGEHVGGTEINPVACTAVGADVLRDTVGCNAGSVFGSGAVIDGNFVDDTVMGAGNLHGTAANVVIGPGTPNAGDTISVTLSTNNATGDVVGMPLTISYTVVAGDSTALLLTQHVHAAIDNNAAFKLITYTKPAIPQVPTRGKTTLVTASGDYADAQGNNYISFHTDGTQTTGMQLVVSASCTGTCPVTVAGAGASAPLHNTLLGRGILTNPGVSNPQYNTFVGHGIAPDGISLDFNTVVGAIAGQDLSTDVGNTFVGAQSGPVQTGANNNTMIGYKSGLILTNGGSNTFLGTQAGAKVTTGGNNLCLGSNACNVTLATGSNNIVLTTSSTQGDTDTSSRSNLINIGGVVRFQNQSLAAPVLSACGTSTIDANANNVTGTISFAGTPTSCTMTFAGTGYRVFSHCQVMSQIVNAGFAYSYTKTAITLTGTALAGNVDYWCSGN